MLSNQTADIIAWVRGQILADGELADLIPPDPWEVDVTAPVIISAGTGTEEPQGFPQLIKPVRRGLVTEAVAECFDPPGETGTARYVVAAASPPAFRAALESRLAMLGLCHRLLAAVSDEMVRMAAQHMLRQLAAGYKTRAGYNQAWAPGTLNIGQIMQLPAPAEGAAIL